MEAFLWGLLAFCIVGMIVPVIWIIVIASQAKHQHDENKDDCDP